MHLPPELHGQILRHLDREDVALYRLVCRNFAFAGAPSLFERLHFRTSLESLQRLSHISKRECGRHVKHLLWNTTGSEYEARAFLEGLRMRELKHILGLPHPHGPTRTMQKQPSAPGKEAEEATQLSPSLGIFVLTTIFAGFPNLQSLYVLTSRTCPSIITNEGWTHRTSLDTTSPPDPWPKAWKATNGCPRCSGLCQAVQSTGRYEMQAASLAAHTASRPLTHLRVEHLSFSSDTSTGLESFFERSLQNITDLHLVLATHPRNAPLIRPLFLSTPHLRSLKLWLHSSSYWSSVDHSSPVLRLQDILPSPSSTQTSAFPFPALREFEIHQLDVSQDFIEGFLLGHAGTLRVLKMHRLRLDPRGSWFEVFERLRGGMGALEVVWLQGEFEDGVERGVNGVGWDMDGDLGRGLEAQLLGV